MYKNIKIERLFSLQHRSIILAMDHQINMGRIKFLDKNENLADIMRQKYVNNIMINLGMLKFLANNFFHEISQKNFILNLSAGICCEKIRIEKKILPLIEIALKSGACAVAVQINFNEFLDGEGLRNLGELIAQCERYCLPVMAMVYVNEDSISLSNAVRIIEELGVDIIKVPSPILPREFILQSKIPILIAGGLYDDNCLYRIDAAISAGYRGAVIGRNLFENKSVVNACKTFADKIKNGGNVSEVYI